MFVVTDVHCMRFRYLDRYEKVHFLGEDGQQADDDDEDSRHRKWSARALHSVPLTYNHAQHNIAGKSQYFSLIKKKQSRKQIFAKYCCNFLSDKNRNQRPRSLDKSSPVCFLRNALNASALSCCF